jgi:hypothetical protein
MATVNDVLRRLKDSPQDLKLTVLIDGTYYDIDVNKIKSVYVVPEKSWETEEDCYGIADKNSEDSFQVLAIE